MQFDVHAIDELKTSKGLKPTDDSSKYDYQADASGTYSKTIFSSSVRSSDSVSFSRLAYTSILATILAIRQGSSFVDSVKSGDECGFVLDRTNFYAESGGQVFDEGYIVKEDDEHVELQVHNVQVRGGYILHVAKSKARSKLAIKFV